jgi:hypothetical protein
MIPLFGRRINAIEKYTVFVIEEHGFVLGATT